MKKRITIILWRIDIIENLKKDWMHDIGKRIIIIIDRYNLKVAFILFPILNFTK